MFFFDAEAIEAISSMWEQLQSVTSQKQLLSLQGPAYFLLNENGRQIWIRDCYERLANIIMDLYKERLNANVLTSRVGAVITGNPGIGKSFFLFYLLWVLAQRNVNVVLRLAEDKITCLFRPNEIPQIVVGTFYHFKDLDCIHTIFLCDPKPGEEPVKVNAFTIIASSPKKSNFKEFLKRKTSKFYMPVWSLEELKECNSTLWNLPANKTDSGFSKFGGIPRYILDMEKSLQALHETIALVPDVDTLFKDVTNMEMAPESSHKLLQYSVSESFTVTCVKFASEYVYVRLRERFYENNELQEIKDFLKYEKVPEKRGVCGMQWQFLARSQLLKVMQFLPTICLSVVLMFVCLFFIFTRIAGEIVVPARVLLGIV
jgi:hypothetical protein